MSFQKNFVIKNGLEVNDNLIFADKTTNKVGIGTTIVSKKLEVLGGVGVDNITVSGIATVTDTLHVDGYLKAGDSTGISGDYLISTGTGVTWANYTFTAFRNKLITTATAGQTGFTTAYAIGMLDVFVNGVKLAESEYTATDGANITLSSPCFGGESVEILTYTNLNAGIGSTGTTVWVNGAPQWITVSSGIYTGVNVGVGTTNPKYKLHVVGVGSTALFVDGNVRITGILTVGSSSVTIDGNNNTIGIGTSVFINGNLGIISATKFVGDGSQLIGVANTGININSNNSPLGTAGTINFGTNLSVSLSSGIATVTASGGSGSSQWVTTAAGIHTLSNVGIGTTNPTQPLQVGFGTNVVVIDSMGEIGIGTDTPIQKIQVGSASTTDVFVVDSFGRVGMGVTNPSSRLQITKGVISFTDTNNRIGDNTTGCSITNGTQNTFIGSHAGRDTTSGSRNIFIGACAGRFNSTGCENIFFGTYAGANCAVTGTGNHFFGRAAGRCLTSGDNNNIFGCNAGGGAALSGNGNNFFGYYSGRSNTSGSHNNFLGDQAGRTNTTGSCNNFFGRSAGCLNNTGSDNNFFGRYAGFNNSSGTNNIFIGCNAGCANQTGIENIVLGRGRNTPITSGSNQLVIGAGSTDWINGNSSYNVGIGTTNPTSKLHVIGAVNASGGFISVGSTTPVQITLVGNKLTFTAVGIGSTTLTLT